MAARQSPAPSLEDPVRHEARRRTIEERARAESLVRDERARLESLAAQRAMLEPQASRARRAAAAVAGSAAWDRLARVARQPGPQRDARLRLASSKESRRVEEPSADEERWLAAARLGKSLRRRRFRAARRQRVLERGAAQLAAPLTAALRRALPILRLPAVRIRRPRSFRHGASVSIVLAAPPLRTLRGATRLLRSDLSFREVVVVPTGRGDSLGAAVAEGCRRATGDIVAIAADPHGAVATPPRIGRLLEALSSDDTIGMAAEVAVCFEWAGAAPRPIELRPDADEPRAAVALSGDVAALRRELLARQPPCADYDGWPLITDLSLAAARSGLNLAAIPPEISPPAAAARRSSSFVASAVRPPREPTPSDVALLRSRWGPALRQRILADLLAGGGEWCSRPARVTVDAGCPPAVEQAVAGLGLDLVADPSDADVAIGKADDRLSFDWLVAGEHRVPALSGPVEMVDPQTLGAELAASIRAPAFAIRVGARDWDAAAFGGDASLARSLARELGARGHQVLLQVDADADRPAGYCLDVLLVLRGRKAGEPTPGRLNLIWQISHPDEVATAELDRYDRVLVASRPHARALAASVRPPVETLLQFTDSRDFRPAPAPRRHLHDVVFVGNWRGTFRRIVWDALATNHPVALYGRGWSLLAPDHAIAEHLPHHELPRLYSSCSILLCDHWDDMRDHGFISNRVFDALACETFVIADANAALADELPGMVETYADASDLGRKIDRYLADEEERARVARRGRSAVLARHTAAQRADELLRVTEAAARACNRPSTAHLST